MPPSPEAMYEIAMDMLQQHTPSTQPGPPNLGEPSLNEPSLNELVSEGGIYAVLSLAIAWAEVIRQTRRTDHTTIGHTAINQRSIASHRNMGGPLPPVSARQVQLAAAQFVDAWCAGRHDEVTLIAIGALGLTESDAAVTEFLAVIYGEAHAHVQRRRLPPAQRPVTHRRRRRMRRHR